MNRKVCTQPEPAPWPADHVAAATAAKKEAEEAAQHDRRSTYRTAATFEKG